MTAAAGLADRVAALLGEPVTEAGPVGGGSICRAVRLLRRSGGPVFAKTLPDAPPGFFAAEAAGLRLLGGTGTVAVPEVLAADDRTLVLEWVEPGPATPAAAERLGRELAALHRVPAPGYGTAHPAFIGSLPCRRPAPGSTRPAVPRTGPPSTPDGGCCPSCGRPPTAGPWHRRTSARSSGSASCCRGSAAPPSRPR
ncbi:fructosamine kinase family protein [Actinacidiphila glaucinigra]|uniref:fructosamine kinase family protein n=1 Tax=Actinacidiphila glaucinigra TaxID=235986 RepID=UPI003D8E563F